MKLTYIPLGLPLGLFVFLFCWYMPSMRSLHAYEEARDKVFDASESCYYTASQQKRYENVPACFAPWEKWISKNEPPDSGWHMPWFVWKEK